MEIKWLEDFLSLAETGNFSKSAAKRNVTQPAFSRRIKSLEFWAGADLFDRNEFPVRLTEEGRKLRGPVEEVLRLLDEVRGDIRGAGNENPNRVRFAALHTLAVAFFPGWFGQIRTGIEDISASMKALDLGDGILALEQRNCDYLLSYGHATVPVLLDSSEYAYMTLAQDELVPVSMAGDQNAPLHQWPGNTSEPASLLAYTPNCLLGKVWEDIYRRQGGDVEHCIVYENSMSDGLRAMVLEGHGLAWLPRSLIESDLAKKVMVPAAEKHWSAPLEVRLYRFYGNHRPIVEKIWREASKKTDE